MHKVKILVVGPCQSGKTAIANFLSDATETSAGDYHPTQGCRILEFECDNITVRGGKSVTAEVELWDCSGDTKFENCWPVIAKESSGVVFVYNQDQANHGRDLEQWYQYFVDQMAMRTPQCIIMSHHKGPNYDREEPNLPSVMNNIKSVHTNLDEEGENLREEFSNYLSELLMTISEKREQEELSIMNDR